MFKQTAALAFAALVASTTLAHAQASTSSPATGAPAASATPTTEGGQHCLLLREAAAIGTGVILGATLSGVVIGHGFIWAGAALGGWVGEWYYGKQQAERSGT